MSKQYIISEERLMELLIAEAQLDVLEQDGVDDWTWYMESRNAYIADCLGVSQGKVRADALSFEDVAIAELSDFQEF